MSPEEDDNKEDVRRLLWPAAKPMTKPAEEDGEDGENGENRENQNDAAIAEAHDQADATLSQKKWYEDFNPEDHGYRYETEDYGHRYETERHILKPVSRLARTTTTHLSDGRPAISSHPSYTGAAIDNPLFSSGLAVSTVPGNNPSTPTAPRTQSAVETPRTSKALRVDPFQNASTPSGDTKPSPGAAAQNVDFDPSPKHYLALGTKSKPTSKPSGTPTPSAFTTPRKTGADRRDHERGGLRVPDRPHSVKTAPPAMHAAAAEPAAHEDDMDWDESPSLRPLRRQMEGLRMGSRAASLEHPAERPAGPRPFTGAPLPETPTKKNKGKRGREDFEKTKSLSGRDVAREREILSQFAAAGATDEDVEDEEEDEEMTPKASVLNRHLEK